MEPHALEEEEGEEKEKKERNSIRGAPPLGPGEGKKGGIGETPLGTWSPLLLPYSPPCGGQVQDMFLGR